MVNIGLSFVAPLHCAAFGLRGELSPCRNMAMRCQAEGWGDASAFSPAKVCKALWSAVFSHFATGNQTSFIDLVWYLVTSLSMTSSVIETVIGMHVLSFL